MVTHWQAGTRCARGEQVAKPLATRSSSSSVSSGPRARHGVIAARWKPGGYPRTALISFLEEEYIPAIRAVRAVRAFRAALPADERERTIDLCMDNCSSHVSRRSRTPSQTPASNAALRSSLSQRPPTVSINNVDRRLLPLLRCCGWNS